MSNRSARRTAFALANVSSPTLFFLAASCIADTLLMRDCKSWQFARARL
jgi:hypothetical protein